MNARMRRGGLVLAALLSTAVPATSAAAATFRVTTRDDTRDGACDAECSVREAVGAANARPGADTVLLPPGEFYLSEQANAENGNATRDLDVTDDLTMRADRSGSPEAVAIIFPSSGFNR
jgi:CSLREA domain-containing protein